uniref:Secreted protein n=1 Tax=Anopheles quadriannulatus TaxID=34691 RepID=A0A182XRL0_ANOQN
MFVLVGLMFAPFLDAFATTIGFIGYDRAEAERPFEMKKKHTNQSVVHPAQYQVPSAAPHRPQKNKKRKAQKHCKIVRKCENQTPQNLYPIKICEKQVPVKLISDPP